MTKNRLEDLLARLDKDFNAQYTGHCADIISHIHVQPGSPEWADAVCQEYSATRKILLRNLPDNSAFKGGQHHAESN